MADRLKALSSSEGIQGIDVAGNFPYKGRGCKGWALHRLVDACGFARCLTAR